MYKIKKLVDKIDDELFDSKDYAEHYVEEKAAGHSDRADIYRRMAQQELDHASYLHTMAVEDIQDISKVFVAPADMIEQWETAHKHYADKSAWIKTMLSM